MGKKMSKKSCLSQGGSYDSKEKECSFLKRNTVWVGYGIVGVILFLIVLFFFSILVGGIVLYVLDVVFGVGIWSWWNAFLLGIMIFVLALIFRSG